MPRISKSELIKLQKQLGTDEAIGKKFGITRQAVHQLRKKYGIESTYAGNPERNAKIIDLYKKGAAGTALAEKFDISISQAYRIINEAGAMKAKKATAKKKKKK
jgi:DNA invertase Pin-like site-specific DNA recombinase